MQNEQAQSTVTLNGEQAKNELTALEIKAKKLKEQILAANKAGDTKAFEKYSKQLEQTNKAMTKMNREAFDVKKVLDNLSGSSLKDLEAAQRKLNATLRSGDIKRGTKEWEEYRQNLTLVRNEIRGINKENQVGATGMGKVSGDFRQMVAGAIAGIAALSGITRKLEEYRQKRMQLEDAQASLKSITGLSDEDIEWLTKQASKLSTSLTEDGVRITATSKEILEGYTVIGSKRPELLKNKEAMAEVTKQALTLAAAGKVNVVEAFEAVTASMNQFNLEADQSSRVINVLGAGSLEGSAEISDLAGSMKNVGTVASTSNLSLEETVALLEVLASKQLLGEEAGTKLRGAILKMKEANVGYVSGVFNMRDALDEINQKLDEKKTASQKDALMQKVFGTENLTAGMILLENVETYDRLTKAITGTTVAQEQAKINTGTSSAKWAQLKNKVDEAGMSLVKGLNPALLATAQSGLAVLQFLGRYPGVAIAMVSAIGALTVAYVSNTVAAMANALWTKVVGQATEFATTKTAKFFKLLLTNPYVAIGAVIISITTALFGFAKASDTVGKAQREFNDAVKDTEKGILSEKVQIDAMFNRLKAAKKGTDEYVSAKKAIIDQYGQNLEGMSKEIQSLDDTAGAYRAITEAVKESANARAMASVTQTAADDYAQQIGDIRESIKKQLDSQFGKDSELSWKYFYQLIPEVESGRGIENVKDTFLKQFDFTQSMGTISTTQNKLRTLLNQSVESWKAYQLVVKQAEVKFGGGKKANTSEKTDGNQPNEGDEKTINGKVMVFSNGKWILKKSTPDPEGDKKVLQKKVDKLNDKTTSDLNDLKQKRLDNEESVNTEEKYQDKIVEVVIAGLEAKKKLYAKGSSEYLELDAQILDIQLKAQEDAQKRSKETAAKSLESFKKSHESELSSAKANDQLARMQVEQDLENGVITQDQYNQKLEEQDAIAAAERLRIARDFKKEVGTFMFASEEEKVATTNAANDELLEAQKSYQATRKKQVKDDLEEIKEIEQRNSISEFQKKRSQYRSDLAILKDALKNKKISLERYNQDVQALNAKHSEAKAEDVLAIANQAATLSARLQDTEALAVENRYAKQLKAAEGNAEATAALEDKMEKEKKAIKKKYADVDLAISVAQIIANTAAAVMKAAPNIPLQIFTGLTGAAELALAVQQRNQIKNLWTGGYTDPGDKYAPAGIVHKGEFVGSQDAVNNKSIKRIFDLVDYAQRTNTVARISNDDIVRAAGIRRGFSAGGFGDPSTTTIRRTPLTGTSLPSLDRYIDVLERMESKLDEPFVGIVAITGKTGIEKQTDKYKRLIKNASR